MKLKIKKLYKDAITPTKSYKYDAGIDLYSKSSYNIYPGKHIIIDTGIAMHIPEGYYGQIFDRSGIATKKELHCIAGVIDSQYRGEIKIAMTNLGERYCEISAGDKIAQMVILPVPEINIEEVDELNNSERGENGFGSTGK